VSPRGVSPRLLHFFAKTAFELGARFSVSRKAFVPKSHTQRLKKRSRQPRIPGGVGDGGQRFAGWRLPRCAEANVRPAMACLPWSAATRATARFPESLPGSFLKSSSPSPAMAMFSATNLRASCSQRACSQGGFPDSQHSLGKCLASPSQPRRSSLRRASSSSRARSSNHSTPPHLRGQV